MFICSVRASTLRFIGAAVLCAVLLFGTLILSDGKLVAAASGASVSYTGRTPTPDGSTFSKNRAGT